MMMLSWMAYALVVGALVLVAATALDRVAAVRGSARRFVWTGAIAAALVWPAASALVSLRPSLALPLPPLRVSVAPLRVVAGAGASGLMAGIETTLIVGWLLASAFLLARLAADVLTLGRLRRAWPVRELDGRPVRLTNDVGPAVVGVRSMELVVPEWLLSLDEPLRALVLRHEEEHRRARDPHLLIGARLAIAVMPWNPAIWYASIRLRLAIELDCDARVLRADPSPQRYGMLLLTIAQRRSVIAAPFGPMLSESATQLERRIIAMQPSRRHLVRLTTMSGTLIAAGALALACSVQSDAPTASAAKAAPSANKSAGYSEFRLTNEAKLLPGNPMPRYPDDLRLAKVEGSVLTQFVVNADGTPDTRTFKVLKSSNPEFTSAVKNALGKMRFAPADVDGHRVRQLVTMPFVFSLSK